MGTFKDELRAAYRAKYGLDVDVDIAEWAASFALTKAAETCDQISKAPAVVGPLEKLGAGQCCGALHQMLATLRAPGKGEGA